MLTAIAPVLAPKIKPDKIIIKVCKVKGNNGVGIIILVPTEINAANNAHKIIFLVMIIFKNSF